MAFYSLDVCSAFQSRTSDYSQWRGCADVRSACGFLTPAFFVIAYLAFVSSASAGNKVYTNQAFGYTGSYPADWVPSGLTYANAFEIRNYERGNPEVVPARNRASLVIVDTISENMDATEQFLDSLPAPQKTTSLESQVFLVDGRRAVTVRRVVPARLAGKGTLQRAPSEILNDRPGAHLAISTYIGNGRHMIALEASAPAEADESVIREIMAIEQSVRFEDSNQPASTKPNPRKK